MKLHTTVLIISLVFFSIATTNAQNVKIGAKIGFNTSTIFGNNSFSNDAFKFGGVYGFLANFSLCDRGEKPGELSLQTELLLSQKGSRNKMYEARYRRNYLEVPVLAQYTFTDGTVRPFVEAGPSFGFWTCGSNKYNDGKVKYDFDSDRDGRFDVGLNFGGGAIMDAGCGELMFGARANIGLVDSYKDMSNPFFNTNFKNRNFNFSLSAAYRFGLGHQTNEP